LLARRRELTWTIRDAPSQHGKTAMITGGNTGIGFATARLLAVKGARVLIACRTASKGQAAVDRIRADVPGARIEMVSLDLASLSSVRSCAATVIRDHPRLDILVNNAGIMMPPLSRTVDGFELQFGTNVLGHFALTGLLLPLLDSSSNGRIVALGSVAHWCGSIDFENLNAEKAYGRWNAYAQSKLAAIMLAHELERRLRTLDSRTISMAAHPGGAKTELQRNNGALKVISKVAGALTQAADDGALPSLRAATDPAARGGDYFGPTAMLTFRGPPVRQRGAKRADDPAIASRLWGECERQTGVTYP
jgi:NAD(P)-dependent dehydrogenase (short-subunit alcohol dehydrogenase family)